MAIAISNLPNGIVIATPRERHVFETESELLRQDLLLRINQGDCKKLIIDHSAVEEIGGAAFNVYLLLRQRLKTPKCIALCCMIPEVREQYDLQKNFPVPAFGTLTEALTFLFS